MKNMKTQSVLKLFALIVFGAATLLAGSVCTAQPAQQAVLQSAVDSMAVASPIGTQETNETMLGREGVIILRTGEPAEPVFLFSVTASSQVQLSETQAIQTVDARIKIVQGKPKTARIGISGPGEVVSVQGEAVASWSVGKRGDQRFLDIELVAGQVAPAITIEIKDSVDGVGSELELTHLTPGNSVGFDSRILLLPSRQVEPRVIVAEGFMRLTEASGDGSMTGFQTAIGGRLKLRLDPLGAKPLPVVLRDMELVGTFDAENSAIDFQLTAKAIVSQAGVKTKLLNGELALSRLPEGDNYRLNLNHNSDQTFYELEFPNAGEFDVRLDFVADVLDPRVNWRGLHFTVTSNSVVPITLKGLPEDLEFRKEEQSVVPIRADQDWRAFLPATGNLDIQWKTARSTTEGKLFFTTKAKIETQIGPGLMRQDHQLEYQILQGQLDSISVDLVGPGEILDVAGQNVVGWKVVENEQVRKLEISLAQPLTGPSQFQIRSQTPLTAFPVRMDGLVLKPQGAIRHSGHLRISNLGSVRLTPLDLNGLTQLGPENYPGEPLEARQLFVYRFPSADYSFAVSADRIKPEININELIVYSLSQGERVIDADVELDIREAGIREWSFDVPADYSIVAVTGANVADYIVATDAVDNRRDLKVIFAQDVLGRQLISLRLEKNQGAEELSWDLPPILYPAAKSVRGDIGVVGAPGFRVAAGSTEFLVEKPLSTFPKAVANLQQAFRIRQPDWSATMQIELLDRSIQSDLFHLSSLSQGTVYGSVLVNYFVTGAPTAEWKLNVPETLGNVTVEGQDIRAWRREGDTLLVTLHQPVMGAYTLLVTYEQKPNENDGSFVAGQVAPLDVQGDRGFVQIVSPMQVEIEKQLISDALLELDPLELPAEFRLLSTSPSLGTWQYTQRPFDLQLKAKWFEPGTTASQVVEYSEANSHVSPDGELVTDVVYYVKSRGQRSLRIKLPGEPVRLWAVSVNNQPVTARQADDMTLIPLPGGADPNVPIEVSLRLGKPAVAGPHTQVTLPVVFAPVLKTQWKVDGDENYVLVSHGGTVEATRPVVWPTGFDWLAKYGVLRLGLIAFFVVMGAVAGTVLVTRKAIVDQADENDSDSTSRAGSTHKGLLRSSFVVTVCAAMAIAVAVTNGWWAFENAEPPADLQLSLPVLAAGETVGIEVQNVPSWQVHFSWAGVAMMVVGLLLLIVHRFQWLKLPTWFSVLLGVGLLSVGALMQPNGAVWFFGLLALAIAVYQCLPAIWMLLKEIGKLFQSWNRHRRDRADQRQSENDRGDESTGDASGVVTSLIVFAISFLALSSEPSVVKAQDTAQTSAGQVIASPLNVIQSADSLVQNWTISNKDLRLTAKAELQIHGVAGDQFVLLRSPAVLSKFEGEGLQLTKREVPGVGLAYVVTIPFEAIPEEEPQDPMGSDAPDLEDAPPKPEKPKADAPNKTAKKYIATFEYQLDAIRVSEGLPILTGSAALHKVLLTFDQPRWEVTCPGAARIRLINGEQKDKTEVELLLRAERSAIVLKPRARDLSSEETRFFVEAHQLYIPGPGVVDGRHRLRIRTAQGRVGNLLAKVPDGLTVSAVNGPVTGWRFDADNRQLNLEIDSAAEANFEVVIETQRALEPLPTELTLEPMRVESAGGEVGLVAIAFGSDAQPERIESEELSQVNVADFDGSLVGNANAVVQRVYRYGLDDGSVSVRVIPVSAEVRVSSRQVISLGDERIVLAVNFVADIARTGLFQLSFVLPEGLEVESLSGESLHHWTEVIEDSQRRIVMHLNGKTIGTQQFALALAGAAPTEAGDWQVPNFQLDDAERQSGELLIRPIPGIRLRSTTRQNVSELDPRSMGAGQNGEQGTLAFRLLQRDWNLVLGIEKQDPWVTAQLLHEISLREGQTRTSLMADVQIENASIRSMLIQLPISDPAVIKTVRATGSSVSDFVRTAPDSDIWELQFKRRVIGRVQFQIEYERRGDRTSDSEMLTRVAIPNTKMLGEYFAVRAGGRLEIDTPELAAGWQQVDWNVVPGTLRESGNRNAPALTLRASAQAAPLVVRVIRHMLADALKLRVAEGTLTTVLSPSGDQLTSVDVTMEVIQRSSLAVQLPEGGQLFSIFVNGESVNSIRQDDNPNGWQFYILPGIDDRTAKVRFVYLATGDSLRDIKLVSPELNVPLENVSWNVIAPEGFELTDSDGNLELIGETNESRYDKQSYLSKVSGKRKVQAEQAAQLLQQANDLLQAGEQSKARWALSNVANRYALDKASNEDARVQLENLQTQQAIVGLNTRRQRLFLDNKLGESVVTGNQQLLQAAAANPILQQDEMNFRPQELSQLLAGNTSEDNAVLQEIAKQLVQHQRSTEPASQAIVISLPEEGTVYRFSRGVQVAENAPLQLDLKFHSQYRLQVWQWFVLGGLLVATVFGLAFTYRSKAAQV